MSKKRKNRRDVCIVAITRVVMSQLQHGCAELFAAYTCS
jgi:hypothetical protein